MVNGALENKHIHLVFKDKMKNGYRGHWKYTLIWIIIIITLSYKTKIIDEPAIRQLYLPGIAFLLVLLGAPLYAFASNHMRLYTKNAVDQYPFYILILIILYNLAVAYRVYPETFRAALYVFSTPLLVILYAIRCAIFIGCERLLQSVSSSVVYFAFLNLAFTIVSIYVPEVTQYIGITSIDAGYGIRPVGIVGDPTFFGALFSFSLLLYLLTNHKRNYLIIFVLVVGAIFSGSRNAILSFLASFLVGMLVNGGNILKIIREIIIFSLSIVVIGLNVLYFFVDFNFDFYYVVNELFRSDDEGAYIRIEYWTELLRLALSSNFFEILLGGEGGVSYISNSFGSPYNGFLRIYFNHGFIVLITYMVAIIVLLLQIINDKNLNARKINISLFTYWFVFSQFYDSAFGEFFHVAEFAMYLALATIFSRSIYMKSSGNSAMEFNIKK